MRALTTYEVRCAQCGQLKWPRLPERPERYVCVLCRAIPPMEAAKRRETAHRAQATRKARQKTAGDATGAIPDAGSGQ